MFMNDGQIEQSGAEWSVEQSTDVICKISKTVELNDYQILLNAVDAARAVLAADEHDYDLTDTNAE